MPPEPPKSKQPAKKKMSCKTGTMTMKDASKKNERNTPKPDKSTKAKVQKQLATTESQMSNPQQNVAVSNMNREHVVFIRGSVQLEKSSQSIATMCNTLINLFLVLQEVCCNFVWYVEIQKFADERDSLTDPKQFPIVLSKLKEYAHGVKPKADGGQGYFTARVGFDVPVENFYEDARGVAEIKGGSIWPNTLPVLEVSKPVFLKGSWQGMDPERWTEFLLVQVNEMLKKSGQEPVQMKLVDKPLYLGKGSTNFSKINDTKTRKKREAMQRALHANFPKGQETSGKKYLTCTVKSELTQKQARIHLHICLKYNEWNTSLSEQSEVKHSAARHMQLHASVQKNLTHHLVDIHDPIPELDGRSMVNLIMDLPCPGNPLEKAFLAVDEQHWGEGGHSLLSPVIYEDVPELVKNLEGTLYHKYGKAVLMKFTPEGYDNALEAEWDKDEQRVIPESKLMARMAKNDKGYKWLIAGNLNKLLGDDASEKAADCPE